MPIDLRGLVRMGSHATVRLFWCFRRNTCTWRQEHAQGKINGKQEAKLWSPACAAPATVTTHKPVFVLWVPARYQPERWIQCSRRTAVLNLLCAI